MAVWFRFTVILVAFSLTGLARASAEPQILGLIASLEPTTLQCERGQCGAEFTSFCIEKHRKPPAKGSVYHIHDPETLIVEGVRGDGQTVRFPALGLLDIASARGRSAVRISVPAGFLKDNGLASIRVTVGERATLIPEPNPTAYWVHTDYDIAVAAGPLRNVAAAIIDHGGERTGAALLTARLVNALPRAGRASEAERDQVWSSAALPPGASGYALVEAGFDQCYQVTRSGMMTLRQCLGSLHDRWISKLNVDYWAVIDAGS
jgi:hypothetical protein